MSQRLIPYDIGCEPSPSDSGETLLQDGRSAFLLFCATSQTVGASGYLEDLGVAVLECIDWAATKFGYPNDEGLPEHPLYSMGLSEASSSVLEVSESEWAQDVQAQICRSADRIWGSARARSPTRSPLRHFVICLKDRTFECLAVRMEVHYAPNFSAAFSHAQTRLGVP